MRLDPHFMGKHGKREKSEKNGECFAPIPVMICRIRRASKFQIKIFKNIGYEGIFSDGFRSFSTAPKSKMLHLWNRCQTSNIFAPVRAMPGPSFNIDGSCAQNFRNF